MSLLVSECGYKSVNIYILPMI
uniref:Uncharacterized protein n=1 Tax=Anguilla anguilla TaxID=7936 RepID=A0A0E9SXK8_ANGAN